MPIYPLKICKNEQIIVIVAYNNKEIFNEIKDHDHHDADNHV